MQAAVDLQAGRPQSLPEDAALVSVLLRARAGVATLPDDDESPGAVRGHGRLELLT